MLRADPIALTLVRCAPSTSPAPAREASFPPHARLSSRSTFLLAASIAAFGSFRPSAAF
jgi:hypothetical protein